MKNCHQNEKFIVRALEKYAAFGPDFHAPTRLSSASVHDILLQGGGDRKSWQSATGISIFNKCESFFRASQAWSGQLLIAQSLRVHCNSSDSERNKVVCVGIFY